MNKKWVVDSSSIISKRCRLMQLVHIFRGKYDNKSFTWQVGVQISHGGCFPDINTVFDNSLEKQIQGLREILNVAQVVVSSLDQDEVLQDILHSAMAVLDMPAGAVALYDAEKNQPELHAHAGLSAKFSYIERWQVDPGGLTHEISTAVNFLSSAILRGNSSSPIP